LFGGCQALQESGSLTEAAIKQIKLDHQKRKLRQELKKSTEKTPAILAAETARNQDSSNPEKWYNLGMAYWNDYQSSMRPFSQNQAISNFETVLKMVPGNVVTINVLYNIYYRELIAGDAAAYDLAQHYFGQLSPEQQKKLNPPDLAKYIYAFYAQRKANQFDYKELHQILLAAIKEQPYAEASYIQLAKLYSRESYYPLAIATLNLGLELNLESVDLIKSVASTYEARASANGCYYDNQQYIDKASRYYLRAIPLQTDSAELHSALAKSMLDRDMPQLAEYETQLLLGLKSNIENYAFAAHNYALMGKKDKANDYLEMAKTAGLPATDSAYHEIYMISGDWLKAALSFTDYIQSQKRIQVYDVIKADIISQQSKINLAKLIDKKEVVYASDWQTLLYAWWQGEMTQKKLLSVATNKCERAEFYFYSGYKSLRAGDKLAAKSAFNSVIEQNTYRFIERPLAKGFLSGLQ